MITTDIISELSRRRQEYREKKLPVPKLEILLNREAYRQIIADQTQWMPSPQDELMGKGTIQGVKVVMVGDNGTMLL